MNTNEHEWLALKVQSVSELRCSNAASRWGMHYEKMSKTCAENEKTGGFSVAIPSWSHFLSIFSPFCGYAFLLDVTMSLQRSSDTHYVATSHYIRVHSCSFVVPDFSFSASSK
jgi:hypothetical protein